MVASAPATSSPATSSPVSSPSAASSPVPSRFLATAEARRRFGERLDRLAPYLTRVDPLADAVVEAFSALPPAEGFRLLERALAGGIGAVPGAPAPLRALFEHVDRVPFWVDWAAVERGGLAFLRAGMLGGLVLGLESLVLGYASPGGNKPLVFSGRLQEQAPRRLAETSRFVHAVSQAGGLRRSGDGFAITVKVRVMHAQVRRLLWQSGRWRAGAWGEPVNQHDMIATILLFSVAMLDGFDKLGYRFSPRESDDLVHLWRYVGHLMGVEGDLLPASRAEALETAAMIRATQGPPDDDARTLVAALLSGPLRGVRTEAELRAVQRCLPVIHGICRALLGDELADQLAVPRSPWARALPALRPLASAAALAHRLPLFGDLALDQGDRYWKTTVSTGLGRTPADFAPPERFVGTAARWSRG
jgi:hypothetical protein